MRFIESAPREASAPSSSRPFPPGGAGARASLARRHRRGRAARLAAVLALSVTAGASGGDDRYLEDFEFLDRTIRAEAAAIDAKDIDWKACAARLRPRFADCDDDVAHVRNVMELLACLRDSHTGVTRSSVPWEQLPGKFDGLYGGGLWFGFDDGRFVLRGVMAGHPEASRLTPGATLVAVDGAPAWLAMARERARVARYRGISSDHSFFASSANRMLPFGDAQRLGLTFLAPDGELRRVEVPRWGPGGKAFQPSVVRQPEGVGEADGATSGFLDVGWGEKVGYLRISGSMDRATADAFHAALDRLEGLSALLLDCRGMGGGGDGPAWEMCGRFFAKAADNGRNGSLEPTGAWQFTGPLVMLQDEVMVSSAETFTWAMRETGRAVTVGRRTGGWSIIPKGFSCPSGLVDFRLGVNDRPTPIGGIRTEGVGFPPDVEVPLGPKFCAAADPEREVATELLRVLAGGVGADDVRAAFGRLSAGDIDGFERAAVSFARKAEGFDGGRLAERFRDDLLATLELEEAASKLSDDDAPGGPDWVGLARRAPALEARAKEAGASKAAAGLRKRLGAAKKELAAQEALLDLVATGAEDDPRERDGWSKRHGKTALGRWMREHGWR